MNNLDSITNKFRELLLLGDCCLDSYSYDASSTCGGHIVKQSFEYQERKNENSMVCDFLRERQMLRKLKSPKDKMNNALITIAGSPGSGKSTFLVNFPSSKEYATFLVDFPVQENDTISPLVSTVSFNSDMDGCSTLLGLRMLYGIIYSMGIAQPDWLYFCNDYEYSDLSALDAVRILLDVFGNRRRFLFLVDEISKAGTEAAVVMNQLGQVLNHFGIVDIIVSSLSPNFIHNLLTDSQRPIQYVILQPMLVANLGRNECNKWADTIIQSSGNVHELVQNLLRNVYYLYSGNPRALSIMKDNKFQSIKTLILDELKKRPLFKQFLFNNLLNWLNIETYTPDLTSDMNLLDMEKFVFSPNASFSSSDDLFRKFLEKGTVFVQSQLREVSQFTVAFPALSLLHWLTKCSGLRQYANPNCPCTRIAIDLLGCICMENNPAVWWERMVALTIAIRSSTITSFNGIFGYLSSTSDLNEWEKWNVSTRLAEMNEDLPSLVENKNVLTVFTDCRAGFDAHATLCYNKNRYHFYIQMKIQFPNMESLKGKRTRDGAVKIAKQSVNYVLARGLVYTLLQHLWHYNHLADETVHYILYNWGDEGKTHATPDGILEHFVDMEDKIKEFVMKNKKKVVQDDHDYMKYVRSYITNHFSNVHVVARPQLMKWLLPSLLPFPMLFSELDVSNDIEVGEPIHANL